MGTRQYSVSIDMYICKETGKMPMSFRGMFEVADTGIILWGP